MTFKEYGGLDLVKVADEVLQEWKKNGAFEKSLELREGAPEFIFFEGPPSANGMPGIHHVMARSIKDAVCRYKTQTGYKVRRRAGWDTHGLPVELGVEKKLGITKEDIGRKISVEEYNRTCREEVMKYTAEWRNLTERIGYWVDMDDPYITYDNRYIETLWYLLKDIHGKGLLYKGKSIQPYSPAAQPRAQPARLLPRREGHHLHRAVQGRRRGESLFPRMDHHPLDPALQHRALRGAEHRLREGEILQSIYRGTRDLHSRQGPCPRPLQRQDPLRGDGRLQGFGARGHAL